MRIVAAPSHGSRHQDRPHTSPAHHAQQLWPGMEHGHAAVPSQREQLLRQAQAAEAAQQRPQQRRARQPGGTWGVTRMQLAHTECQWAGRRVLGLHEQAPGPHRRFLLSKQGFMLSAQVHAVMGACKVMPCKSVPSMPPACPASIKGDPMCTPAVAPAQWLDLHRQQLAEALAQQRAQEAARAQRLQQQQRLRQQAQLRPPSSHLEPASDWHPYITRQRPQEPPVSGAGHGRQPAGFWDPLPHNAPTVGGQQPRTQAAHSARGRPGGGDQWRPHAAAAGAHPDPHRHQEQAWAELLPPGWGWPWQQAPQQHVHAPTPRPASRQRQERQAAPAGNGIELVWVDSDGEDGSDVEVSSCSVRRSVRLLHHGSVLQPASCWVVIKSFPPVPLGKGLGDVVRSAQHIEDPLSPQAGMLTLVPPQTMAHPHGALWWPRPVAPAAGGNTRPQAAQAKCAAHQPPPQRLACA